MISITKAGFPPHFVSGLSPASISVKFRESYRTDSAKDNPCYGFTQGQKMPALRSPNNGYCPIEGRSSHPRDRLERQ
ncbi:MAG: hypothetical protein ACRC8Y_18915 [Chroococcales cyanobacterium]